MSSSVLTALFLFAFVTSITPGPNNTMLLASGVHFGFTRTIPHMLGIGFGFFVLLICVGMGLGTLITGIPMLYLALKIVSGIYLLYIAWKIGSSRTLGEQKETGQVPMTFLQAAAFQWVNPKAWVMAITAMSTYGDPVHPYQRVFLIGAIFALINVPSVSTWAGFGSGLRGWLSDPVRLKWFNITMAILLVVSLWPILE